MKLDAQRWRRRFAKHRVFLVAAGLGALLRVITMLGYQPAMWFNDSYEYVSIALHPRPHPIRPDGYGFWLLLLKPFHSFAVVVFTQHLMGLATAVLIYALLRRKFGLPGWAATLASAPVLLDAYQIQLEQLILSDAMFTFLVVAVITLVLWHRRPSPQVGAAIGLLLAVATLTRSIGLPILVLVLAFMIIKRYGLRAVLATVTACAIPLIAYMGWFKVHNGVFAMTNSDGLFLYARSMAFAECQKMRPSPDLIPLCSSVPPSQRPPSQYYIWLTTTGFGPQTAPAHRLPGSTFNELKNETAGRFARQAILKQPGDYASVIAHDFFITFRWERRVFPDPLTYDMYEFGTKERGLPTWSVYGGGTARTDARLYHNGKASTSILSPFADIMRIYQDHVYLRGTMLGVIMLAGLWGIAVRWRRLGGPVLLPWLAAFGLLLAPAATAEFDYRYVLPTVPLACLAAAIALRHLRPPRRVRTVPVESVPTAPRELIHNA